MSIDAEIQALERQIAAGDLAAWPRLDEALLRAGRAPRRVWMVNFVHGEYSDRSEGVLDPVHSTKAGALEHMKREACSDEGERFEPDPEDAERYVDVAHEKTMFLSWSELVP